MAPNSSYYDHKGHEVISPTASSNKDGELFNLEQVVELSAKLIGCMELPSEDEWNRIRDYIYARFDINLPSKKPHLEKEINI